MIALIWRLPVIGNSALDIKGFRVGVYACAL